MTERFNMMKLQHLLTTISCAMYQEGTWGGIDKVWWWKDRNFLWFL